MQRAFAASIRNPTEQPAAIGVPAQRMALYQELFRKNVERFLARIFAPAKRLLGDSLWGALVRGFYRRHPSQSPYFRQIGGAFLAYLESRLGGIDEGWEGRRLTAQLADADVPPNLLLELCHFRWVKFSLRLAQDPEPPANLDPQGDLLHRRVLLSPLACPLAYRYPVHALEARASPLGPERPSFLIARRCGDGEVRVLVSNALTNRLLELLGEQPSGRAALAALAAELPGVAKHRLEAEGAAMLNRLRRAEVLLGAQGRTAGDASQAPAQF